MLEVRETRLPGVGTKFTMETHRGESVCVVVHTDGMREVYHFEDPDDDAHRIALNDDEARQVGALLGGVIYRPQLVQDLEMALGDLVVEWIELPAGSPLVGLTVMTCRIRRATGSTIVAIMRGGGTVAMPHPDEILRAGDVLVVIGRPEAFAIVRRMVVEGPPADDQEMLVPSHLSAASAPSIPSDNLSIFRQAIAEKRQVRARYDGGLREVCPHALGTKDGQVRAFVFQFAGYSRRGLPPGGGWRCLPIDRLTEVSLQDGQWYTGETAPDMSPCIDQVDLTVGP
jgi:TrkA domain protein